MRISDGRRGGFTLVELLIVIGIIAVLISILLPALSKVRIVANMTQCRSNLRQFGMAVQFYVDDAKGWLPMGHCRGWTGPQGPADPAQKFDLWEWIANKLQPNSKAENLRSVVSCSEKRRMGQTNNSFSDFGFPIGPAPGTAFALVNNYSTYPWKKHSRYKSSTVMFADSKFTDWLRSNWGNADPVAYRHMVYTELAPNGDKLGLMNVLYFDGHVDGQPWSWLGKMSAAQRDDVMGWGR